MTGFFNYRSNPEHVVLSTAVGYTFHADQPTG